MSYLFRSMSNLILLLLLVLNGCVPVILGAAAAGGVIIPQDRSLGTIVDDTSIWLGIKNRFIQYSPDDLFVKVNVDVSEGIVLLTGAVKTSELRIEAHKLALMDEAVVNVVNEIEVSETINRKERFNDFLLAKQIKAKLLLEKNIKSLNYSVEVVNKVVYFIGIAYDKEELSKVLFIARRVRGVKKVVNYVRIRNFPTQSVKSNG